jgi:hypothetical protein
VVLLALCFPLLICVFVLVMERLEAALFPAPPPAEAGAAGGADDGGVPAVPEPRQPGSAPPARPAVPWPREPLPARDGMPAG